MCVAWVHILKTCSCPQATPLPCVLQMFFWRRRDMFLSFCTAHDQHGHQPWAGDSFVLSLVSRDDVAFCAVHRLPHAFFGVAMWRLWHGRGAAVMRHTEVLWGFRGIRSCTDGSLSWFHAAHVIIIVASRWTATLQRCHSGGRGSLAHSSSHPLVFPNFEWLTSTRVMFFTWVVRSCFDLLRCACSCIAKNKNKMIACSCTSKRNFQIA